MPRKPAYDAELFTSVAEENAYILRQIELFHQLQRQGTTEADWVAFKMGISRAQAQRKIERAQGKVCTKSDATAKK